MLIWLNGPFGGGKTQTVLRKHNGPVIAPMTVIDPTHFEETVGRLRDMDHEVHHLSLPARRETVLKRSRGRGLGRAIPFAGDMWALSKVDECLAGLSAPAFATHVRTDDRTIPEVADHIATAAGMTLLPNKDTRLQAYARSFGKVRRPRAFATRSGELA